MREEAEARARDARLARMKWFATGLLVLAGGIYVTAQALRPRYPWLYYVGVTAEAAMVGAIADWFAVTALFHHPFGLRFIPHTAIIPRNKARIASGLSHFIESNFLTGAAVVQRIRDFQPARTLYRWLLRAENAEAVATYVTRLAVYGLQAFDDERVRNFLTQTIVRRLRNADVAAAAAELLDVLTENRRHHELLDAALRALDELLARPDTQAYLAGEVAKSAPLLKWLSDLFQLKLDERAALKIVEVAVQKIREVRESEGHELRRRFDGYVADFMRRLKIDEGLRDRVHRLRDEALASPALAAYLGGLWDELRAWLAAEHDRRPASLHQRITAMLEALGRTLAADREIQNWIDEQILRAAPALVEEHRAKIGRFIEDQVMGWQERRLVLELERHIGPDLQYIRINGTLVGGLAGLLIAAATQIAAR
ncbi:MAG: DUF445 domain-containing protein [Betaproteobacteria bacterium]|nr:DUF445 domain-containing protein [Betaproteobacteria bacterium]